MAEVDLKALLEHHVELFNEAVRTGDYGPFLDTFADDAVMRFDGVPLGPFQGRAGIAQAYASRAPTDTMALIDMQELGPNAVRAALRVGRRWHGEMYLRWEDGRLVELQIAPAN